MFVKLFLSCEHYIIVNDELHGTGVLGGKYCAAFSFSFGVPMELIRLIKTCLNELYSEVRIGEHLSEICE
jgi:hypothetical protein